MRWLVVLTVVSGCWYGPSQTVRAPRAEPATTSSEESYRATTITVDAIGVAAMGVGLVGLTRGYDEDISGSMLGGGMLVAGFATPIIHLAHGHKARAGGSYLVRSLSTTFGTFVGAAASCQDDRDELFCFMMPMFWGAAGGLAVGSAIDAVFFHDQESPRTWTPTVQTSDGVTRVGILGAF